MLLFLNPVNTKQPNTMNKTEMYEMLNNLILSGEKQDKAKILEALSEVAEMTKPKSKKPTGKVKRVLVTGDATFAPSIKMPPQCIEMQKIVAEKTKTKPVLKSKLMLDLDGDEKVWKRLRTRQAPSKIYAFYQRRLIDAGGLKHEVVELES